MKKVAILGHFGGDRVFLDGQTVKTKTLYDELKNYSDLDIKIIDTYWKTKRPVKLLFKTLFVLIKRESIIVLLSGNGMKFFFPLLSFFSKHWNVKIYHDVIGGNLDKYVVKYPKFKKYLCSFEVNWVETDLLKFKLEELGISNCEVIPNFKRLKMFNCEEMTFDYSEPYRFCTFSRVMREKGIEDAIYAIEEINKSLGRVICTLDIYGSIEESYSERFEFIISNSSEAIKYRGLVPYDESVSVLKDYYALLFPTFWDGEGFPGTIVDAFSSGLPVLANDWNSNNEIIQDSINGFLYPSNRFVDLRSAIEFSINNPSKIKEMKIECINKAKTFQPDKYVEKIFRYVNNVVCNK